MILYLINKAPLLDSNSENSTNCNKKKHPTIYKYPRHNNCIENNSYLSTFG